MLKFGSGDDYFPVKDVVLHFRGAPQFSIRSHCEKEGFTKVLVDKSCNELMVTGTGSDGKDGETYFPLINIFRVAVDYLPGFKRQG